MATSQFNAWARRYAGVIAVTGLVVAVVGVIASVLGVRAAYDIAQRSGAFAKGDPRLVLGGVAINTIGARSVLSSIEISSIVGSTTKRRFLAPDRSNDDLDAGYFVI